VLSNARRSGVGSAILGALIEQARRRGMRRVMLNAQTQAAAFYRRHGFTAYGEEFLEAGIPHIAMTREI
jgi:predicted GNAT family N-acyltransferase